MIKEFCDLCEKELSGENSFTVAKWHITNRKTYCKECFTDRKNWKIIQRNVLKKE